MIDPTKEPYVLPYGAPETCALCKGPLGYDDAQKLLCCATEACPEYGKRILWLRPVQWFNNSGNIVP